MKSKEDMDGYLVVMSIVYPKRENIAVQNVLCSSLERHRDSMEHWREVALWPGR